AGIGVKGNIGYGAECRGRHSDLVIRLRLKPTDTSAAAAPSALTAIVRAEEIHGRNSRVQVQGRTAYGDHIRRGRRMLRATSRVAGGRKVSDIWRGEVGVVEGQFIGKLAAAPAHADHVGPRCNCLLHGHEQTIVGLGTLYQDNLGGRSDGM